MASGVSDCRASFLTGHGRPKSRLGPHVRMSDIRGYRIEHIMDVGYGGYGIEHMDVGYGGYGIEHMDVGYGGYGMEHMDVGYGR